MSALTQVERLALGGIGALTALAAVLRYAGGAPAVAAFTAAALALAGQAWLVSTSTEQLGYHFGPRITGALHSTLGNLPEFFVVLFALEAGERTVAETALIGSILVNALLVLGLVIIVGALHSDDGLMRFRQRLPMDTATLMLIASFIILLVGLAGGAHDSASHHIGAISVIGAGAILVVYVVWSVGYLRSAEEPSASGASRRARAGEARLGLATSVGLLAAGALASAATSDWFVHALAPSIRQLHISRAFAGLVIVAIAGNAVENVAGVTLARRGHPDLAISIVKSSVAQLAAFLYPLLVIVSLLTATRLTFAVAPVYIGALFGTAVIVWQITGDGEATAFEGTALVAAFVILATVAAYE